MTDDTCPLCNQPHINKLEVDARLANPSIREDYTVCKQILPHENEHWYIHERQPRMSVSKRKRNDPPKGVLHRLFGPVKNSEE